jgi:hypothetical protein
MADLTDVNGKPIQLPPKNTDTPLQVAKMLYDVKGNPISLHPQGAPSIQPPSRNTQERDPYQPSPVDTSQIRPQNDLLRSTGTGYGTPDILTRLASALPAIGATVGAPEGGAMAVPGAAAGSFIKRGLQSAFPKLFGSIPQGQGAGGDLADTAMDTVGAGVLPGVLGKGISKIASIAQAPKAALADTLATTFKDTAPVQKAVAGDIGDTVNAFTNNDFSSVTNPNLKATRELFAKGYSPSSGKLDAGKLIDELKVNPDAYKAIPKDMQGTMQEFLEQAQKMQSDKTGGSNGHLLSMVKNAPVLAIPGAVGGMALGGAMGHGYVGATVGAGAGIILGEKAISKLMSNPEIARLTIQAMKQPGSAESSKVISKVLLNALRGTEVLVSSGDPDSKPEKAVVNEQGIPVYPKRQE